MKKIVIIAFAFFLSVSAMAQIRFGVKAGGNVSKLSGIDMGDGSGTLSGSSSIFGFHVGVYANYSFNRLLGIQPEVIFSMQGGKDPGIKGLDVKGGTYHFNYINIPLLLDVKPFKTPLSFLVGPQLGYCVSRSFIEGINLSNNDYYKDFDFSIALGIQYCLTKRLVLGLRYNYGLTKNLKFDYGYDFEGIHYNSTATGERNNVLQLSAGWTF